MQLSRTLIPAIARWAGVPALALVASCATWQSASETYSAQFGRISSGSIILFVAVNNDGAGERQIVSGSVFEGPDGKAKRPAKADGDVISRTGILRLVSASDAESGAEDQADASRFFTALADAIANIALDVFDAPRDTLQLTIVLEPADRPIDALHFASLSPRSVPLTFHVPAEVSISPGRRSALAALFGHETYHALDFARRDAGADADPEFAQLQPGAEFEFALRELAADIFGRCVALQATGTAVQEEIIEINGRRGSVLTDRELQLVIGNGEPGNEKLDGLALSRALTNTVWASVPGQDRIIGAATEAGNRLASLCAKQTLGSPSTLISMLQALANDGINAPPLD